MAIPAWLEGASAAGQAIGGIATVVGVAYAIVQVGEWRKRIRGEAAGAIFDAVSRCCHSVIGYSLWVRRLCAERPTDANAAIALAARVANTKAKSYRTYRDSIDDAALAVSRATGRLDRPELILATRFLDEAANVPCAVEKYSEALLGEQWQSDATHALLGEVEVAVRKMGAAQSELGRALRPIILGEKHG